uniref:Uncharacterized protein n=1 Tax=Anopheles darlingi TaxID=43151 RepID=A0A2M4DGA3_ANODA
MVVRSCYRKTDHAFAFVIAIIAQQAISHADPFILLPFASLCPYRNNIILIMIILKQPGTRKWLKIKQEFYLFFA